ncbi:hypothetical protein Tco_0672004 [Tanacetum coccineum]
MKAITTRSGATLAGPSVPPPSPSKEVDREPKTKTDQLFEALAHMPKFAKMVKDLLTNKDKLLKIANTPVNENCSAVILKKLPEKLRDTGSSKEAQGLQEGGIAMLAIRVTPFHPTANNREAMIG